MSKWKKFKFKLADYVFAVGMTFVIWSAQLMNYKNQVKEFKELRSKVWRERHQNLEIMMAGE